MYSDEAQVILLHSSSRLSQQFSPNLRPVISCGNWYVSFYCDIIAAIAIENGIGDWEVGLLVAVFFMEKI